MYKQESTRTKFVKVQQLPNKELFSGPATWPDPACQSGDFQSPIDIPKNITYVDTSQWLPFQFTHYEKPPRKMEVSNNGHSAVVTFEVEGCNDKLPKLSQGNLPATYELAQFHFHWGWYGDHKGSEHTIHGVSTKNCKSRSAEKGVPY